MVADQLLIAVIGDVAGSRKVPDRATLQRALKRALTQTNKIVPAVQPLEITLGDEFQGLYTRLPDALDATLWIRLRLFKTVEVRFGVGAGGIAVPSKGRSPFGQDGPVWWAAKDCLDRLRDLEDRKEWPPGWRTAFSSGKPSTDAVVNAFLVCRDQILQGFDLRDAGVLLGLLRGHNQERIGKDLGISQSAVSQRGNKKGSYAVLRAHQRIREIEEWPL